MMGFGPGSSSVTVLVKGLTGGHDLAVTKSTVFNVVAQSDGRTLYGAKHVGSYVNWNDSFAINMKDLEHDDLTLVVFMNDHEYGRTHLSLMEIANTAAHQRQRVQEHELRDGSNNVVGYLTVDIHSAVRQEIVGGLHPPSVTLRSGAVQEQIFTERGIEKNHASRLNIFSCMDASDMGWEAYPYKFKSRLRSEYSLTEQSKLLKSERQLMRASQQQIQ